MSASVALLYLEPSAVTGIILEYEQQGELRTKSLDLLNLSAECAPSAKRASLLHTIATLIWSTFRRVCPDARVLRGTVRMRLKICAGSTDVEVTINQIIRQEPLITENRRPQLRKLLFSAPAVLAGFLAVPLLRLSMLSASQHPCFAAPMLWSADALAWRINCR